MGLLQIAQSYGNGTLPDISGSVVTTPLLTLIPLVVLILFSVIGYVILYFVIRLAVRHGMRDHDKDVENRMRRNYQQPMQPNIPPQQQNMMRQQMPHDTYQEAPMPQNNNNNQNPKM